MGFLSWHLELLLLNSIVLNFKSPYNLHHAQGEDSY